MSAAATLFDNAPMFAPSNDGAKLYTAGAVVSFVIPGTPRGKQRPRASFFAGHARIYTPAETARSSRAVRSITAEAMAGRAPFARPISVRIGFYLPIPRSWSKSKRGRARLGTIRPTVKPDFDNAIKLLADGCNTVVWLDDKQIVEWSGSKFYSDTPRTVVEVSELIAGYAS